MGEPAARGKTSPPPHRIVINFRSLVSAPEDDGNRDQTTPRSVASPLLETGARVGDHLRLRRSLATGGMAEIWVAEHLELGIDVAVKFLRRPEDQAMRDRLEREAQVASRVDHPGAVRVFDEGHTDDGTPFIVMELLDGESLAQRITRSGPMQLDEVREVVSQVASVLEAAHARGIVHRDIKPDNVMLLRSTGGLRVKVVDFGIAKPIDPGESTQVTGTDQLVGTPIYMAPEQLFDGHPADERIYDFPLPR